MNKINGASTRPSINNKKPKLMYYSDCDYFAGSENMISILTSDVQVKSRFELVFAFRWNALYEEGARVRLPKYLKRIPVRLITMQWIFRILNIGPFG